MAVLLFFIAFGMSNIATGSVADPYKGKEAWGYINVREDAYMFWWMYYKDCTEGYANYPLVVWLQGGPGGSSTGHGNFNDIGPYDSNMKPRNTSWIQKANLLFLDSPVGSGFSYVNNKSALAQNNSQIAEDLVITLTSILQNIPEFQKTPLYIIGESYGGKVAADFSLQLNKAIKAEKVTCNLKGVVLGVPFISPMDIVSTWGSYLYTMSMISRADVQQLDAKVAEMKELMAAKKYVNATLSFIALTNVVANMTNNVDIFNVLKQAEPLFNQTTKANSNGTKLGSLNGKDMPYMYIDPLTNFMNSVIREKLHVIPKDVTWGGQAADVFTALQADFMKPVTDSVETLLNETSLKVNVYNGQLDVIINILGTLKWVENLKWPGIKDFLTSPRQVILLDDKQSGGFVSESQNFRFFWILKAGHSVTIDAREAALKMLGVILS